MSFCTAISPSSQYQRKHASHAYKGDSNVLSLEAVADSRRNLEGSIAAEKDDNCALSALICDFLLLISDHVMLFVVVVSGL